MENNINQEENKERKITFKEKIIHAFKKGWIIILMMTIIGGLTGLVIANKSYRKKYVEENNVILNFRYTDDSINSDFNYINIISQNNIDRCKKITKSLETGSNISTYQYVTLNTENIKITKNSDSTFTIKANKDAFNVGKDYAYNDAAAKGFLKHLTILPFITDEEIEEHSKISEKVGHEVFNKFDKDYYQANSLDADNKIIIEYANPEATKLNNELKIKYYIIWISSFLA